jgi:hypothetical protein
MNHPLIVEARRRWVAVGWDLRSPGGRRRQPVRWRAAIGR